MGATTPLRSAVYDTELHGNYLNLVCVYETNLQPVALTHFTQGIEQRVGPHYEGQVAIAPSGYRPIILLCRRRRTLLDIAVPLTWQSSDLTIPHRQVYQRDFLLKLIHDDLGMRP